MNDNEGRLRVFSTTSCGDEALIPYEKVASIGGPRKMLGGAFRQGALIEAAILLVERQTIPPLVLLICAVAPCGPCFLPPTLSDVRIGPPSRQTNLCLARALSLAKKRRA